MSCNYYKDNKDEFINSTINCDMSYQYNLFEKYFVLLIIDSVFIIIFN